MSDGIDDAIANGMTYGDPAVQHALFTRLRQEDPVRWTQPAGFRPFWTVSRHADVLEVEKQNDLFINAPRAKLLSLQWEQKVREVTGGRPVLVRSLPQMDGAEHRSYRQLTAAWFQPKQVRSLEPRIHALARRAVDDLLDRRGGLDFYADIAVWYPLRVIMTIMGLPASDEAHLLKITQAFFSASGQSGQQGAEFIGAAKDYEDYFKALARERRANPTDDVASLIVNSTIDGEPIGDHEARSYFIALASAGHDTTSTTAAGGLLALIQNPQEWDKLKANADLIPSAVDEMVRWESPVKHFFRTATADYTLRGQRVRQGDALMMCYPSANRDEAVFDDPFSFRVGRTPNRHVGFGYGAHACLGMFLAKIELQALMRELVTRVDRFDLDGAPAWAPTPFVGGVCRLPVRVSSGEQRSPDLRRAA
jgi:cytochrome P450